MGAVLAMLPPGDLWLPDELDTDDPVLLKGTRGRSQPPLRKSCWCGRCVRPRNNCSLVHVN